MGNRHLRILTFGLLTLILVSCSETLEEMDEWETQLATELKATSVQFSHMSSSTTTNGIHTASEVNLQLDIVNSEVIGEIAHNERILSQKCDEIRDKTVALAENLSFPAFNELKINLISKRGALIFKTEKTKTVTYRIH